MPNTKTTRSQNPSPCDWQNPAITPLHEMPPELLRKLSAIGIEPSSIPDPDGDFVGISSAVGSSHDDQAALDAWIAAGGIPEFDDTAS